MKTCGFFIFLLTVSVCAFTPDFRLQYRAGSGQIQVVSEDDIKTLAAHGVSLDAIKEHLDKIDKDLDKIHTTLDKDVLPTIYVMDFFKWLFGALIIAIIGAIVGVIVNNRFTQRHTA
jgi:hypothetical protein